MATHRTDGHRGGCLNVSLESLHVRALSYFLESSKTELRSVERNVAGETRCKITGGLFVSCIKDGNFQMVTRRCFDLTLKCIK